jgi:DNA (cytosine-5)-methyltransferase 1
MEQVDMFQVAPKLELNFNEPEIAVKTFAEFEDKKETINYSEKRFGDVILNLNRAANTITSGVRFWLNEKQILKSRCYNLIGSYPTDYKFNSDNVYMIGMSVPPVMVAQIATEIYSQWLARL